MVVIRISVMCSVSRMTKAVEVRVAASFPAALFDRMIEHHSRKGLRPDCDCDFCRFKRVATGQFSYLRRRFGARSESDGGNGSWDGDQEFQVREAVRGLRRKVRAELNRIKADI